ncbi:MAG TPA: TetR family transcriptional regulator [Reyranella sp.]|jgi:TetR/AcrR family transcriptional repressor of nem operon|nr:TetR family transcriptional regulator [Reyranella sp.]
MPQNPARTARTRAEILDHAGRLFRLRGYAGTNIDDVMLAAGLTRGAFYAHFNSKDDLFTEAVIAGTGLRTRLRGAPPGSVLKAYLDKAELVGSAPTCVLATLPSDVARAPLPARLAYANLLHAAIGEIAGAKKRKLGGDATVAVILAVGAVALARASGDTRLSDWLLRCAERAARPLLRPRASPRKKRSTSRRKAAGARRSRRAARSRGGRAAGAPKARSSAARR